MPLVVVLDVGDCRDAGLQDVGGVQPAAEADLDQGEVDVRPSQLHEGGPGERLELGRWSEAFAHPLDGRRDRRERRREPFAADRLTVDGDPLAIADQVGLRHGADAQARLLQRGSRERHHAALAVRSADERSAQLPLRIAELVEERLDARQAEVDAEASAAAQGGYRGVVVQPGGQGQAPSSS